MADNWLKALGGKLLDAGAAYMQQARLVEELKALSPAAARERFFGFVQGLSPAARSGFALVLASLANSQRSDEARRFVQRLQAALADPSAWPAQQAAQAAQAEQAEQADGQDPALAAALQQIEQWMELPPAQQQPAIERGLQQLDAAGLQAWRTYVKTAQDHVAQLIEDHRDNEARFAAGRFIEDQMHYRAQRIAGMQPDQGWLAELQRMQDGAAFLDRVEQQLAREAARRQGTSTSAAPAGAAAGLGDAQAAFEALPQMLDEALASGHVLPERAATLRSLIEKMRSLQAAAGRGEIAADAALGRMRELMAQAMPYFAAPGTVSATASPRGRELLRYAGALRADVMQSISTLSGAAASEQVVAGALRDLTQTLSVIGTEHDASALAALEAELLRPAARSWLEFKRLRHSMVARPLWQPNAVMQSINTLFYSGGADLVPLLESAATPKRLQVDTASRLQNHGQFRWDALNAAHVGVFDLRGAQDIGTLAQSDPKRARQLTGTAYELGLAFALGKPVIVLAGPGDVLPFDIDVAPVLLDGVADDADLLAQALDEAFYVEQRSTTGNAIADCVAELEQLTRGHPQRASMEGMGWLSPGLAADPADFHAKAQQVLQRLDGAPRLLQPAWPGAGVDRGARRCFHVMPFRPPWADAARDTARVACTRLGISYRRGDEAEEGRIVHAIWDDLCRASVVLVELAGGNLNVMIELGLAHAIGRPVLLVHRKDPWDLRPRHIEKLRVHYYETPAELDDVLNARLPALAGSG